MGKKDNGKEKREKWEMEVGKNYSGNEKRTKKWEKKIGKKDWKREEGKKWEMEVGMKRGKSGERK